MPDDKHTQDMKKRFPGNDYTNPEKKPNGNDEQKPVENSPARQKKENRVSVKKKTLGERIADAFLDESVRKRFISDWVFPGVDTFIGDLVHSILLALFGDSVTDNITGGRFRRRNDDDDRPTMKYHDRTGDRSERRGVLSRPSRAPEITFLYREDAEKVWKWLQEDLEKYHRTSLKDFYEYVSKATDGEIEFQTDFQMKNLGWFELSDEPPITHVRNGWLLEMPRTEDIRR